MAALKDSLKVALAAAFGLFLMAAPALAGIYGPPSPGLDLSSAHLPDAWRSLGIGLDVSVAPGSVSSPVSAGTGYADGDDVTLTCSGCVFTSSPHITVTGVNAGAVTSFQMTSPGVATDIPRGGVATFSQVATTGAGTGLTLTARFAPIASNLSIPQLETGGGAANGNFFLNQNGDAANIGLAGAENTFVGDKAGAAFTGAAMANTALGHDACGIYGAVTPTGSFNTCYGDDAGRNISGTANSNTLVGNGSGRNVSGNNNTALGLGTLSSAGVDGGSFSGSGNTAVGTSAGNTITTGNNNTAIGYQSGLSLTTGTLNVAVGYQAGENWVSSQGNIAVGLSASLGTGSWNDVIGYQAGNKMTTSNFDTIFGTSAGKALTNGSNNTLLGAQVGSVTLATGNNNVLIGTNSSCDAPTAATGNYIGLCAGSTPVIAVAGAGTPATAVTTVSGTMVLPNLPTACTGKVTGTLWNNAGVLSVCP